MPQVDLTQRLHELCELLHVSVHRPRLSFKIGDSQVTAGSGDDAIVLTPEQATRGSWKLMPSEMGAELDRIDNQVTRLLQQFTVRFRSHLYGSGDSEDARYQIRGLYLVPGSQAETLLEQLHEQHESLRAVVREWASDSVRFHDAIRAKLGDEAYRLAKSRIPTLASLLTATRIDAVSIPFGTNAAMIRETGRRAFLQQARDRTREMVEQVARNLVAEPRRELGAAISNLRQLIEDNGRVTARSLAPIKRAVEKLQMFDFVADSSLQAQLERLQNSLDGVTLSEQNAQVSQENGLLDVLRQTAAEAIDEVRIEEQFQAAVAVQGGERRIRLRPRAAV